jgi:hypothetical protein
VEVAGFSPERMRGIGTDVLNKIKARISFGIDARDSLAPPLAVGYKKWKSQHYPPAIRNWRATGQTLGHLQIKRAGTNVVVLGFLPGFRSGRKDKVPIEVVVARNQARSRQWGMSPSDEGTLMQSVRGIPYARLSKAG